MDPIEDYSVLHLDPEASSLPRPNHARNLPVFLAMGLVFVSFITVTAIFKSSLHEQESQMTSMIDEIGQLKQSNLLLSQQVNSQEEILQSIVVDFSSLGSAAASGDSGKIQELFSNILSRVPTRNQSVNLAEGVAASTTEDSTLDVLILGTNGAHTDTIIVASINEDERKISLFSIPRDLYINGRRINEYYTYYGVEQLGRMVSQVTGLEMDHFVQVDLQGFVDIVDILGGLDLYVSEAIYDGLYPNGNGGYSAYSIEQGQHHMTGEEALRYARSRKSSSDFDRAGRQQEILAALRTKVVQLDSVMEMKELTSIFQTAIESTTTDMNVLDLVGYYYDYQDFELNTGLVLSSGNYLYSLINESGAYILLPDVADFSEIHQVISELVN